MTTLKRLVAVSLSAMLFAGSLAGCGGGDSNGGGGASGSAGSSGGQQAAAPQGKTEVTLWASGSDNVRLVFEALSKEFNSNEAHNQGKFKLNVQYIASGGGGQTMRDRVIAAYKAGQKNTGIDLIEMNDEDLSVIGGNGLDEDPAKSVLLKYDISKIPNLEGVSARPAQYADYAVPYRGTTVVMAYNSDKIPNPPKTVDELTQWIKDNPTRFSYNAASTGGAGDAFIRSSVYNFLPEEAFMSNDPKWEAEWDKGFDYLKEIHPFLYKSSGKVVYPNKNQGVLDLLRDGEIDMCPAWADQSLAAVKNGNLPTNTKIYQIEPALTGTVATLGIPSFSGNVDGAYAVINFMLSVDAQNILLKEMQAIPLIDMDKLDQEAAETVKALSTSGFRTQSIGDLGKDINKRWAEEIATIG